MTKVWREEGAYQTHLRHRIEDHILPGSLVVKNDSSYLQGIPDLGVFYGDWWATLEVKKSYEDFLKNKQPNQDWYVQKMNEMSFSAFIYPEIEEEVLDALYEASRYRRTARVS